MGWLWLLLLILAFWALFSAAEKHRRATDTRRKDAGSGQPLPQAETHQPSTAVESAPDGKQTHTITVHLDVKKILKDLQTGSPRMARWSGKVDGPLPIKTLTFNQNFCLSDAAWGKRIVPYRPGESYGDAPENIAFHSSRTVDVLVKHGFLMGDDKGAFVCTDLGLRAFETLPTRSS